MMPELRIEQDGWVTRYGFGEDGDLRWTFLYPVGATVTVEVDDTPAAPIRKWRSREERERET